MVNITRWLLSQDSHCSQTGAPKSVSMRKPGRTRQVIQIKSMILLKLAQMLGLASE